MKNLLLMLFALSTIVLSGCGSIIFEAKFNLKSNFQSPQGPPPGLPSDDQITVQNQGNPVVFGKKIRFRPSDKNAYFFSHPVKKPETTKTIYWAGKLKSGNGPFTVLISGANTPGTNYLVNALELRFSNNEVNIINFLSNTPDWNSSPLVQNGDHKVFVSLRLESNTYRITIQQPGVPEIVFLGSLNTHTVNWMKTHSRVVMQAGFSLGATNSEYLMDDIIMRERR